MPLLILAFAAGVWVCQQQAALAPLWQWGAPALMLLLFGARRSSGAKKRTARCVWLGAMFFIGLSFATWRAQIRLEDELSTALEGVDVVISGYISELPHSDGMQSNFVFHVDPDSIVFSAQNEPLERIPEKISLVWYASRSHAWAPMEEAQDEPLDADALPSLHAGQRWDLTVRLKRLHGSMNPHGFDYEAFMFERGIRASGYVRESPKNRLLAERQSGIAPAINAWREGIRDRFLQALPQDDWAGVLVALSIGDQSGISSEQWTLLRKSGITHLVAISGLHVTLIASLFAALVGFIWRRVPRACLWLPVQKVCVVAGIFAAVFYVALAGFGIPAQRTLYMLVVAGVALCAGRGMRALSTLACALLVVLLFDPWAVLSAGFWLSFSAVGALILVVSGVRRGQEEQGGFARRVLHWFCQWARAQWAVMLVTLPLLLGLFAQFSLISPIVNFIAVPCVSLLVTPLALLFALVPVPFFAQCASAITSALMGMVQWFADLPIALWQQAAPPSVLVFLALLAGLWALMPRGVPARWTALLVLVPLLTYSPARPEVGEMKVVAIDVGQGLSVHVQTAQHDLLFDTGPRYSTRSDSGERIVVPYLLAQGVYRLDAMVISHKDTDHAGGTRSVFAALPVKWWMSSLTEEERPENARTILHKPCQRGQSWQWDGVRFEVLHPSADYVMTAKTNNRSCVLRVSSASGSVLLTGDIEMPAQSDLLDKLPDSLSADVMIAPHHGSKSSLHKGFIDAVGAKSVIFTNGYRNRFGHPNAQVADFYATSGAQAYRSDSAGAITMDFADGKIKPQLAREQGGRYWHGH